MASNPFSVRSNRFWARNFQTKFAIEEALWDLFAKRLQTPLVNLIGGACRLEVPVMRMLGLKPPQETAAEAKALVDRGYRHVKVKIGVDEKRDLETVRRVRDTIGEDVFLSADANQAYAPMEAVRVLRQLENANLGLVEQPVRRDDVRGMAFVRQNVSVPIMADEGLKRRRTLCATSRPVPWTRSASSSGKWVDCTGVAI